MIVPDYQLSLAIGKEGQNARLASRLTGWGINIKSETQFAEEQAYGDVEWADGEWIVDAESGEQLWQPADGSPAMSIAQWEAASDAEADSADSTVEADSADSTIEAVAAVDSDETAAVEVLSDDDAGEEE